MTINTDSAGYHLYREFAYRVCWILLIPFYSILILVFGVIDPRLAGMLLEKSGRNLQKLA
jgi:hypothetical protein